MVRTANQLPPAGPCRVKPDEAPGTFSEGLGGRRTRVDEKQEGNAPAFTGRLCHPQDRDKDVHTCSADFHSLAMRAFSLTGAPSAISAGSYVDASVTKWKASGPGGACSNQERPESKKHSEQMHDAQGWMAAAHATHRRDHTVPQRSRWPRVSRPHGDVLEDSLHTGFQRLKYGKQCKILITQ
nr:uncharacterized protein LOC103247113 isoform X4 [Chlorocebus sabaeus]